MASSFLLFTDFTHFFHFKKQMSSGTASLIRLIDIPDWVRVPYDPHASIPLQLWQTYKHKNLTDEAQAAVTSWKDLNPHMPIGLHDDDDADAFVLSHYGPHVHALYRAFPLGVMRADFWRYAILYQYGGIYSDIDTRCLKPVKQWFPPVLPQDSNKIDQYFNPAHKQVFVLGGKAYNKLKWEDCSLIVGLENEKDICQWVGVVLCLDLLVAVFDHSTLCILLFLRIFWDLALQTIAAVAGHPVLETVLQMIIHKAQGGIDTNNHEFVHEHTGPRIWSEAFASLLGLNPNASAAEILQKVWRNNEGYKVARAHRICLMSWWFFSGDSVNVRNLYGSRTFLHGDYPHWIEQRDILHEG